MGKAAAGPAGATYKTMALLTVYALTVASQATTTLEPETSTATTAYRYGNESNVTTPQPSHAPTSHAPSGPLLPPTAPPHAHQNSSSSGPPKSGYLTYIGAIISIVGNLCISGGLNIQKFVHMKIAEAEEGAHDAVISTNYAKHKVWWLGIALMALGEMGNFGAYFFAPASLVAPLGTVTVVANAIIAPVCLGEAFRKRDGVGVFFSVSGAVLIVIGAPDTEEALDTDLLYRHLLRPVFLGYASSIICIAIGCYIALRKGYGKKYIVIPLFITATLGSFTILSVKSLSMLLRESFDGNNQFKAPLIYFVIAVLVGTAVTQVKFLNYAMCHFDSTQVVPTFFVMFTIAAILIGAIFFEDFASVPEEKRAIFAGGIACCFFGVYLITSMRPKEDPAVAFTTRGSPSGSVSFTAPNDEDDRGDRSYLLLPEEVYGRDRADSGLSLTALNPLLGVETTPLIRTHRRQHRKSSRLTVNGSGSDRDSPASVSPDVPVVHGGARNSSIVSPLLRGESQS